VGAYTELRFPLAARLELEAGLRSDVWITGGDAQHAFEPRALARLFASDWLTLHGAFGLAYQPAVFLIPLPGIADVALDRGLQRAIQSEVGARAELPAGFSLESKLFAHFYRDMLALDALEIEDLDCDPLEGPISGHMGACEETEGFARMRARAYGSEWMLRRDARERISGWLSYTLAKADAYSNRGRRLAPAASAAVNAWRKSRRCNYWLTGEAGSSSRPTRSLICSSVSVPE
jgi:hypothetical protein